MSETRQITTPILKALKQMGVLCFRMNSGNLRVRGGFVHMAEKGTADILAFPETVSDGHVKLIGAPLWIETKHPTGTTAKEQRDAQEAFCKRVESLGHVYIRATCMEDVLAVLR